jgi:hypothetical protein
VTRRDKLQTVADNVQAIISARTRDGGLYARGLAGEGYAGGYRDALHDVILFLNGVKPQRLNLDGDVWEATE